MSVAYWFIIRQGILIDMLLLGSFSHRLFIRCYEATVGTLSQTNEPIESASGQDKPTAKIIQQLQCSSLWSP